jgi:hypothetical protein
MNKPARDRKYLNWVKSLDSVISHRPADDPHHLIGHGYSGMGTKAPDYLTFPLTRDEHTELHNIGYKAWEEIYGSQWKFVAETMLLAKLEGAL